MSPDADVAEVEAPETAVLSALPAAMMSPVAPVAPVSPESAEPPMAIPVPRVSPSRTSLESVARDVAGAESPESPEWPETAVGCDAAPDVASPVSPVLVADAWALEAPESPEVAWG